MKSPVGLCTCKQIEGILDSSFISKVNHGVWSTVKKKSLNLKKNTQMLIGEIASKTGLSRDTIRFYEKKKLITVGRTDSEWNNYKNYTEEVLNKLVLIKKVKSFGFTLKEISELLELYESNDATCEIMSSKVKEKINSIDKKIKDLIDMKKTIIQRLENSKRICSQGTKDNCNGI